MIWLVVARPADCQNLLNQESNDTPTQAKAQLLTADYKKRHSEVGADWGRGSKGPIFLTSIQNLDPVSILPISPSPGPFRRLEAKDSGLKLFGLMAEDPGRHCMSTTQLVLGTRPVVNKF